MKYTPENYNLITLMCNTLIKGYNRIAAIEVIDGNYHKEKGLTWWRDKVNANFTYKRPLIEGIEFLAR